MAPVARAALMASAATWAVEAESAAKIPPVWRARAVLGPKISGQSKSPG